MNNYKHLQHQPIFSSGNGTLNQMQSAHNNFSLVHWPLRMTTVVSTGTCEAVPFLCEAHIFVTQKCVDGTLCTFTVGLIARNRTIVTAILLAVHYAFNF